jgi:hypothetical protein
MNTNTFLLLELPQKMTTSNNNQLKMQTTSEQAARFFGSQKCGHCYKFDCEDNKLTM